jgi:hypothetical protein
LFGIRRIWLPYMLLAVMGVCSCAMLGAFLLKQHTAYSNTANANKVVAKNRNLLLASAKLFAQASDVTARTLGGESYSLKEWHSVASIVRLLCEQHPPLEEQLPWWLMNVNGEPIPADIDGLKLYSQRRLLLGKGDAGEATLALVFGERPAPEEAKLEAQRLHGPGTHAGV